MCVYVCVCMCVYIYIERENHLESELDETSAQRKSPQYTIQSSLSPVSPWIFRFCVDNPWRVFSTLLRASWPCRNGRELGSWRKITNWDVSWDIKMGYVNGRYPLVI